MKGFVSSLASAVMLVAITIVAVSGNELLAQCQGGCNVNTRVNNVVPPETDPLPPSLQSTRINDNNFRSARNEFRNEIRDDYRREIRSDSEQTGLFATVNRTVVQNPSVDTAQLTDAKIRLSQLENTIADMRAQGMTEREIEQYVNQKIAVATPQLNYDLITAEVADRIVTSERFKNFLTETVQTAVNAQPDGGEIQIEIVPVN